LQQNKLRGNLKTVLRWIKQLLSADSSYDRSAGRFADLEYRSHLFPSLIGLGVTGSALRTDHLQPRGP
jgi:hypothetical protein